MRIKAAKHSDFYLRLNDFNPCDSGTRTFVIATLPRTGSTTLSVRLWATGQMGAPLEYLNLHSAREAVEELGSGSVLKYWSEIKSRRSSPNGIFGVKLFPQHLVALRDGYPLLYEEILETSLFIRLLRSDKLAQAISLARAQQSGQWSTLQKGARLPEYCRKDIVRAMSETYKAEDWWDDFFDSLGLTPLELRYDEKGGLGLEAESLAISFAKPAQTPLSVPVLFENLPEKQRGVESSLWEALFRQGS